MTPFLIYRSWRAQRLPRYGSLDWHSSAHMQWSLLQLLTTSRGQVGQRSVIDTVAELETRQVATAPLGDAIGDLVLDWLPRQAYPVRHGVHSNTAFALASMLEGFGVLGRPDVVDAVRSRALDWFADDTGYGTRWEPSGSDFLSPALSEVELMRRVLPDAEFVPWLDRFLPGLGGGGCKSLLSVPVVNDPSDGQLVHLAGLALSQAWVLRSIVRVLPAGDSRRSVLDEAAERQVALAAPHVTSGDFMATHWLVSFALLTGP